MTAYELDSRDDSGELHLVGVLPERRFNPERISDESIINWARHILGEGAGVNDIHYSPIKLNEIEDGVF